MKQHRLLACIMAALLIGLVAGCAAQAPTATPAPTNTPIPPTNTPIPPTNTPVPPTNTPVPPTPVPETSVLQIVGPDGSKSFTMDELTALPATEGQGGIKSSTGKITGPDTYKGVALNKLVAEIGFDDGMGINVVAEDGHGITFSYDQAMNGTFIPYDPGTGDELKSPGPLTAILAYERTANRWTKDRMARSES